MAKEFKRTLRVPDLEKKPVETAKLILENQGFLNVDVRYEESYFQISTVIKQEPPKGRIVDRETMILLTVSQRSYLQFLPGIYQKSVIEGNSFLKNFLWIFHHIISGIEEKIGSIDKLFRPYETPKEFLPWLASWLAFPLDDNWKEERRRYLVKHAVELYRIRGTVKGLKLFVELFADHEPEIIENQWPFKGFRIGVHSTIGIDSIILPEIEQAHCFIVNMPMDFDDVDDEFILRLHDIISSNKPAHTNYFLQFMGKRDVHEWGIEIGGHVIGMGQEITSYEEEVARLPGEQD